MFKHLTRNLKLGLTTLTILTAGAGAAFAQPAGFATAIDPIDDCSRGGGFRGPSYCTRQVVNCIRNPFGSGCATTLGTKAHTVAKVRYCSEASHRAKPACASTVAGVNAAMWAKQHPDAPTTADTRPNNQFLKGTASGLDTGIITIPYDSWIGALYFDTATFDGRALGGDATDGVAFFIGNSGGSNSHSAGILSGTDLGAPITQRSGTASWVGQFQALHFTTNKDFVLEVTFGGAGNKAGSIEAFVEEQRSYSNYHFYLKGDFDTSGLITGTVDVGDFTDNDRDNPTGSSRRPGVLTGLIGQEGAVGAFHSNGSYYSGGFIARPPSELDTAFLNTTCSADPFTNKHQNLCYLEYADDRVTRINDCITGGNASDASQCGTAIAEHSCISNPFASNCAADFTDYFATARTNRIQFCLGDIKNGLCTNSDTVAAICDYAPFASVCFNGDTYESTRARKINFCHTNTTHPTCSGVTDNPNAVAWADSFSTALSDRPSTTNRRSQFLKGTASGVNKGDIVPSYSTYDASLNLNTATFNGRALGGDAADGVAFFRGEVNGEGTPYNYSGIFSGTDLGAPITDLSGTASWVGRFHSLYFNENTDFVLEVDYTNKTLNAFVHYFLSAHYYLNGSYDDNGIITGDFNLNFFNNKDRESKNSNFYAGVITGLIGQDGAVGAFTSSATGSSGYAGGFVARPANVADKVYLNRICDDDPFGYLCYLEKDKQRDKIIECTEGGNASGAGCERAVQLNDCLTNPFATECETDFTDYYVAARTKRTEFCVGDLTNSLCTGTGAKEAICTYAPFASICFDNNDYDTARTTKYTSCHADPSVPSCTGVTDRPNGIAWADSFATALADRPAPPTDGTTRGNQFLKATASGINRGDIVVPTGSWASGSLNLNTAEFNGEDLGGDATDGVAYIFGRVNGQGRWYSYAGIFSGTDLGAPVTQTSGTASWVGRFHALNWTANKEFVLEVDFNGTGDKSGYIKAFVHYSGENHYYLDGSYDAHGLITGTVTYGYFAKNNRDSRSTRTPNGTLTGLIGKDGAVGAFINNYIGGSAYAGGFVARPPTNAELDYVTTTCEDDPFHPFCHVDYEEQRVERIGDCTASNDMATDTAFCGRAIARNPCIRNPFTANCAEDLEHHYAAARTNRIQFCLGNLTNSLCTNSDTVAAVCTYAPFASVCFNGNTYESTRTNKINFCHTNTTHASCSGVTANPNAVAWADSFATALSDTPSTTNRSNQFLKDLEDKSAGNIDSGDRVGDIVIDYYTGSLNLNTATFNGRALDGDAADGVAFFRGQVNGQGTYYNYSGIFSGTDLGAPITETTGTASWVGRFQSVYHGTNTDFVLEVDYTNKSLDAFVHYSSNLHFYLDGNYDDKGIITGDFNLSRFNNKNRKSKISTYRTGVITGLIGTEGAVGAFISNQTGGSGYSGGFVARPANTADNSYLNTTCTNDPFGYLCYLETDKQRTKIIECTEGSNASTSGCERAAQLNNCLTNPFADNCVTDFADYYVAARAKRTEFCVGDLTNSLCTGADAVEAICTYAPFASVCFNDNEYKTARETKYPTCHADPSIPSCTGVTDRPNAIAWADSFATALPDRPAPPTDGTTRGNQFLKATASGVNKGDIVVPSWGDGSLNLNTATFNGEALGGDAADGVAYIFGRVNGQGTWYSYAGIFSGTDLGAPITETSGTASWVGRFQAVNWTTNNEFVLEIDFNGTGDKSGYIKAFVQRFETGESHFDLDGSYDAHGVITGTVVAGDFTNNDRKDTTGYRNLGTLTGLIGKDGAVGAFYSNNYGYAGGFVARPSTEDAELDYVAITCEEDPFHQFCHLEYEEHRDARIRECTDEYGTINDDAICAKAIIHNPCITNPFADKCVEEFEFYYEDARANRAKFCNKTANASDSLCTGAVSDICEYDPFTAICFDSGNPYNTARTDKTTYCADRANIGDVSCAGAFSRPNVASLLKGFTTELTKVPNPSPTKNRFLQGTDVGLDNGTLEIYRNRQLVTLTLADNLATGTSLGGQAADGVAFFGSRVNGKYFYYAGILSGTDLGAPLPTTTEKNVKALWNGKIQTMGLYRIEKDFTLEVTYIGSGNHAGNVEAFVNRLGSSYYYLNGKFDNSGVIFDGTVNYGRFTESKRDNPVGGRAPNGELRGLIGQDGAVGAFISNGFGNYSGGFVARPPQ